MMFGDGHCVSTSVVCRDQTVEKWAQCNFDMSVLFEMSKVLEGRRIL